MEGCLESFSDRRPALGGHLGDLQVLSHTGSLARHRGLYMGHSSTGSLVVFLAQAHPSHGCGSLARPPCATPGTFGISPGNGSSKPLVLAGLSGCSQGRHANSPSRAHALSTTQASAHERMDPGIGGRTRMVPGISQQRLPGTGRSCTTDGNSGQKAGGICSKRNQESPPSGRVCQGVSPGIGSLGRRAFKGPTEPTERPQGGRFGARKCGERNAALGGKPSHQTHATSRQEPFWQPESFSGHADAATTSGHGRKSGGSGRSQRRAGDPSEEAAIHGSESGGSRLRTRCHGPFRRTGHAGSAQSTGTTGSRDGALEPGPGSCHAELGNSPTWSNAAGLAASADGTRPDAGHGSGDGKSQNAAGGRRKGFGRTA